MPTKSQSTLTLNNSSATAYVTLWLVIAWLTTWMTATSRADDQIGSGLNDTPMAASIADEIVSVDQDWSGGDPLYDQSSFADFAHRIGLGSCTCGECDDFHWEFLPRDPLYPFYLADTKQSRMAGQWLEATGDSTLLDGTLGGRFGIFRYVDSQQGPFRRGVQADFEGSAQVRLDMDRNHDVRSVDFRAGVPISFSFGRLQTRIGYYHLSSHVGDEFLLRVPNFDRKNFSRDVLFMGAAYWLDDSTRIYGEAGWAFTCDVSEPWEFTFGIEEAPRHPTGVRGAPFYAVNGHLRQEVDFGGEFTAQLGWAWRSSYDTGLLRLGLQYLNGKSNQFSFYNEHEELFGVGLWYDF